MIYHHPLSGQRPPGPSWPLSTCLSRQQADRAGRWVGPGGRGRRRGHRVPGRGAGAGGDRGGRAQIPEGMAGTFGLSHPTQDLGDNRGLGAYAGRTREHLLFQG